MHQNQSWTSILDTATANHQTFQILVIQCTNKITITENPVNQFSQPYILYEKDDKIVFLPVVFDKG